MSESSTTAARRPSAPSASTPATSTHSAASSSASGSVEGDAVVGSSSQSGGGFLVRNYGDESASASSDADLMFRRTQGSCAFYPVGADNCRAPRSCFDCLNFAVAPERAGCMVNERGQCVSVAGNYSAERDFQYAPAANAVVAASGSASAGDVDVGASLLSGPGAEFSAAAGATYCSARDAKCAACRRGVFLAYSPGSVTRTSLFCLGEGGCVCIALCEMDDWATRVGGSRCSNATPVGQTGSSASAAGGGMTTVNAGGSADESTRGGLEGQGDNGAGSGVGAFWSSASGVLALLVAVLAVVVYLSKRHRQAPSQRHPGTPQAPTLSPRRDPRPPESLLVSLFHRPGRSSRTRRADATPPEPSAHQTEGGSTEGDADSDDHRSLRLLGWRAMRQQVMEKETLQPVVASSGIRRVAISSCVACDPGHIDGAVSSECVLSPRLLGALGRFDKELEGRASLGEDDGSSRRFTTLSLSSSAMLSPPSYVIPFMDERDEEEDEEDEHGVGHGEGVGLCFDELVTPPATSRMLL